MNFNLRVDTMNMEHEIFEQSPSVIHPTCYTGRRHYDDVGNSVVTGDALPNGQLSMSGSASHKTPSMQRQSRPKKDKMDMSRANSRLALEETLKLTDANGLPMKTPVSILQEILSRRGITPSYELVQIEGAIHQPTFRYRVSFNDKDVPFTAMGAGRSKKEAKHAAARALIDKLTGLQLPDAHTALGANVCTSASGMNDGNINNVCGDGSENVMGNPIGWLQEMCMSRHWPPPIYETENEVGLPHERFFTIACTILSYREVGKDKSKKLAKRLAAHKMRTRLQENPLDSSQIAETFRLDMDCDSRSCSNYYGDLRDLSISNLTSQHSSKISQFHKTLKNSTGKKLNKLQKTCIREQNIDYIKLLSEIGNENQFEVTYVDIEERSVTSLYHCLVQLSTLPVGVCHGSGATLVDAQKQAAQNALEYLKIMTRK